jgi:hypothetical protein
MKALFIGLLSGILFAVGLSISGMVNPNVVRGFLNIFGDWNPALAFVMIGAVGFNLFSFRSVLKRKPLCADQHSLPSKTTLDKNLVLGATLFGMGWGLLGICPGPGIVNLATFDSSALLFVVAMTAGMGIHKVLQKN